MKKYFGLAVAVAVPLIASAAMFTGIKGAIASIIGIVSQLRGLVVGLALLYFFWGLATYIRSAGDEKALEKGKLIMIWGVVALFVMTSVGGLVTFIQNELGVSGGGVLQIVAPSGQGASNGGSSSSSQSGSSSSASTPFGDPVGEGVSPYSGGPCDVESSEGNCTTATTPNPTGDSPYQYAPCGPDSFDEIPCR